MGSMWSAGEYLMITDEPILVAFIPHAPDVGLVDGVQTGAVDWNRR